MYDDKFQGCTVDVQDRYGVIQQSVPNLVVGVQTCLFDHHTVYDVGKVHDKFLGCTVDAQAATWLLTISTIPCCSCSHLPPGSLHFMQCR